jgi:hypothetical protein
MTDAVRASIMLGAQTWQPSNRVLEMIRLLLEHEASILRLPVGDVQLDFSHDRVTMGLTHRMPGIVQRCNATEDVR